MDDYAHADEERGDRYLDDEERGSGDSLLAGESPEASSRDERERARDDEGDDELDDESSESTASDEGDEQTDSDQNRADGERRHESDAAPRGQDDDSQDPYSGRRGHG